MKKYKLSTNALKIYIFLLMVIITSNGCTRGCKSFDNKKKEGNNINQISTTTGAASPEDSIDKSSNRLNDKKN
jgi:hypothetical protein